MRIDSQVSEYNETYIEYPLEEKYDTNFKYKIFFGGCAFTILSFGAAYFVPDEYKRPEYYTYSCTVILLPLILKEPAKKIYHFVTSRLQ